MPKADQQLLSQLSNKANNPEKLRETYEQELLKNISKILPKIPKFNPKLHSLGFSSGEISATVILSAFNKQPTALPKEEKEKIQIQAPLGIEQASQSAVESKQSDSKDEELKPHNSSQHKPLGTTKEAFFNTSSSSSSASSTSSQVINKRTDDRRDNKNNKPQEDKGCTIS